MKILLFILIFILAFVFWTMCKVSSDSEDKEAELMEDMIKKDCKNT